MNAKYCSFTIERIEQVAFRMTLWELEILLPLRVLLYLNKTKDWPLVQNAALVGVEVSLG